MQPVLSIAAGGLDTEQVAAYRGVGSGVAGHNRTSVARRRPGHLLMRGPDVSVSNWPQLLYQYGVGGVFFFWTLAVCFRSGAGDLRSASDRTSLIYVLVGLAGYLAFHIAWIVLASS